MTFSLARLFAVFAAPLLIATAPSGQAEQTTPSFVQDYEPKPAIWSLSDEDTTIYLFGTVHSLPPGFKWRSAALERVIGRGG